MTVTVINTEPLTEEPAPTEVEAQADAVEAVADASVKVAEIEANRDIELARIHTESNEAQTDAVLEASTRERELEVELNACRILLAEREATISSLEVELLTRPQSNNAPPENPQNELEGDAEATLDNPASHETQPTDEPARPKRRALRLI